MIKVPKEELFQETINKLQSSQWKIVFDPIAWEAKIVNEEGKEMDINTLAFTLSELRDYFTMREEKEVREQRKQPLDEFTQKRLGVMDYVLIKDETRRNVREIFEAYHDTNGIFTLSNFIVSLESNLKDPSSGFEAYIIAKDAEKILIPLQNFVKLHNQ